MGVLDILKLKVEKQNICDLLVKYDLTKVFLEDTFYYIDDYYNETGEYTKQDVFYIKNPKGNTAYYNMIVSIEGVEKEINDIPMQGIVLILHRLQKYEKEFTE